jgi:phage terminase large subunit-like protein
LTWTTACPDWERRIVAGESLVPCAPIYPEEAAAAMAVFDALQVTDVPGSPTMAQACRPWTRDFVGSIFGAYNAETGRRDVSEWLMLISKKNSKSTTAAGIMLTALLLGWRENAEYIILAPTVEIAGNSYGPAAAMVRADPELSALLHVQDHIRTITHRTTKATLKVVAADSATVGGKKATGILVDELWLFGKQQNAEAMLREACGGMASRKEGFVIYLTTQSDDPPAGVFKEKLQYARDVRDGKIIDPKFVPVLYEFPERMIKAGEHKQKRNFYVTNPNMGASVDPEFIEREFMKAERTGEASLRGFLAKHLNVEIGLALRSDAWIGADFWERNTTTGITLERLLAESDAVTVGIDGGGMDDLLGLAVIGRHADTGQWLAWTRAYCHPIALERRKADASRMHDFARDGDLVLVAEVGDDVRAVADVVEQCDASGLLDKVGVDPIGIGQVLDELAEREIDPARIIGISQGYRLGGSIKTVERKLAEGALRHTGQPLMAWCVANARVEARANSILITKSASGSGKIDPLMAVFNAAELMSRVAPSSAGAPQILSLEF